MYDVRCVDVILNDLISFYDISNVMWDGYDVIHCDKMYFVIHVDAISVDVFYFMIYDVMCCFYDDKYKLNEPKKMTYQWMSKKKDLW